MIRRTFLLGLIATFLPLAGTHAAEPDLIKARFAAYWSAYMSSDYARAASLMHPQDLRGLQTQLLPLFVRAQNSTVPDIKAVVDAFFDGVPAARRAALTGNETFQQLNRFIAIANPQLVEVISKSRIEATSVVIDAAQPSSAIVQYKVIVADVAENDTQQFTKTDGVWYLRAKQSPSDVAAEFKAILEP